jgi:hypothetical protein
MSKFSTAFHDKAHVFVIAIHVTPDDIATRHDVEIARGEGADGIILIKDYNTNAIDADVLQAYDTARAAYPLWWIGVNLLDHPASSAVSAIRLGTSGLWFDQANIDEDGPKGATYLKEVRGRQLALRKDTLLMPSIAFKYQPPVKDLFRVIALAEPWADVLVTSGPQTGVQADWEKVSILCSSSRVSTGLASGVSIDNVQRYMDLGVKLFIVNTSISDPHTGRLDPKKVGDLRSKIPRRYY